MINYHGDPRQCVVDNLESLQILEEQAEITLGSDVEDEPPAGAESGHAWAIYAVEPLADARADQEYTIRIACLTLIQGDASLVVTHRAPRGDWDSEAPRGSAQREAIVLGPNSRSEDRLVKSPHTHAGGLIVMFMPRIWFPLAT